MSNEPEPSKLEIEWANEPELRRGSFVMIFTVPAMAEEPKRAEPPPRTTSTRSIILAGQLAERQMFHYPPYYRLVYVYLKNRNEQLLDLMAQTMSGKLRAVFGNRVLGPDKPPVARIQTLFIRKIIVKIEYNAPMARARELLVQVQKEMVAEDRFKSLIVYYDVDPM